MEIDTNLKFEVFNVQHLGNEEDRTEDLLERIKEDPMVLMQKGLLGYVDEHEFLATIRPNEEALILGEN
ncbi:hypothetical protein C7437_10931 [Psychrobacillus insolitus]|uniref:Uncharacterized protein n=1 Tax=Psychrobacillus insolitus TaxID=1461 RepID=A0A2W7MLS9_9BACI|nr:hypothetical protein [Psychrobacillus insolitus]PZX02886.1 hypothetical protein C7437_10931 [Psychrobacillus insolitus]